MAVAQCGSFSQGARKLYISHSTTSRAVSALEAELGVRLIERENHVIGLTPEGEVLLEEAGRIMDMVSSAAQKVKSIKESKKETEK